MPEADRKAKEAATSQWRTAAGGLPGRCCCLGDVATRNVERFHVGSKRPLEETGKHARAGELLLGCGGDTHIRHFGVAPWDTGQHWLNDTRPETLRLMTAVRTEMLSPTSQVRHRRSEAKWSPG